MKPITIAHRYRYKTIKELEALNADELIIYKKQLLLQSKALLTEAAEWKYTYRALMSQMSGVCLALETELEHAELDRIESDDSDYGQIGYIH